LRRTRFDGFEAIYRSEVMKMYALDLKQGIGIIEPELSVECSVHECSVAIDIIEQSVLQERCAKGDNVLVAYFRSSPVAYLFAATTDTWVAEIDDWFYIAPYEVYLYDAHTLSAYRGRRIYPFLICSAADYFGRKNFNHAIIFSTARNVGSVKGIEKCDFKCYEYVKYHNLLGWKSWHYHTGEKHVESRFGDEN